MRTTPTPSQRPAPASGRLSPRAAAEQSERWARLPDGTDERFVGYGVIGLSFSSGHILGLRRWPASSVGPAYTSVWHRDPAGVWRLYSDVAEVYSCSRYISAAVTDAISGPIVLRWLAPFRLRVEVPVVSLNWDLQFRANWMTAAFGVVRGLLPDRAAASDAALALLERGARLGLGTGPIRLRGLMPNGQQFRIVPRRIWAVHASIASLGQADLGTPCEPAALARLGDFVVPACGLLAFATARFR